MKNEKYFNKIDELDLKKEVIALDNALIKKSTRFNADEQKLFYLALASLKQDQTSREIMISKQAVKEALEYQSEDFYTTIRNRYKQVMIKSYIHFGDEEVWNDGFLFTKMRSDKKNIYLKIEEDYFKLLVHLTSNFTLLYCDELISFSSKYSMILYQNLIRLKLKGKEGVAYSTKDLKTILGLGIEDYVYNGHFIRSLFEKKTIDKAIEEINKNSKILKNVRYEKYKKGKRILGYIFYFDYITNNQKYQGEEKRKIERETIENEFDENFDI